MTEEGKYISVLNEIKEIFQFLTEGEPSPDDEIEARGKLINNFSHIKNFNVFPEYKELTETILRKLEDWDTLDLWFSETSIPDDIRTLLKIPQKQEEILKEEASETIQQPTEQAVEKTEIDMTQIVNKVSEQFKGEIEGLKGTIEGLKKELEKKDQTLKSISKKKEVKKIIPKKEPKLPPPKIRIPVFKRPPIKPQIKTEEKEEPKIEPIKLEPIKVDDKEVHKELTPIPKKSAEEVSGVSIPIPKEKPKLSPFVQETNDIPIITEKRKITPIIVEETDYEPKLELESEEKQSVIFSVEKPKISSMKIEEIETGSIKSSTTDLFNVFSSVGEKTSEAKDKKAEVKEPKMNLNNEMGEISQVTPFINFNQKKHGTKENKITVPEGELPTDKDSLYQELIALEGKRYSLEKEFKDLDTKYQKGSIADIQYKNESVVLKNKLNDITSRINKIRRIIASL
ncbi:MAG: hypothetical protein ACXACC_00310 [Promethearchaeota archaeon]|jgi:hypothetical protein